MPLLSFSIDLCRSTEVKNTINKYSKGNEKLINEHLQQFYKQFLSIEENLYSHCIYNDIDLTKLFLVKLIGDEYWYVYELDEQLCKEEQNSIIVKFINILSTITTRIDSLFISEKKISWEEEEEDHQIWDGIKHEHFYIPRKAYLDISYNYNDFSEMRIDKIQKHIRSEYYSHHKNKKKQDPETIKKDYANDEVEIYNQLNLGINQLNGTMLRTYSRFDPIGSDIDLFFRCTKKSMPALLKVGRNLFNFIYEYSYDQSLPNNIMRVEQQIIGTSSKTYDSLFYFKENIQKEELKGVSHDYAIFTIINHISNTPNLTVLPYNNDGCSESRDYLLKVGFLKLNKLRKYFSILKKECYHYSIDKKYRN